MKRSTIYILITIGIFFIVSIVLYQFATSQPFLRKYEPATVFMDSDVIPPQAHFEGGQSTNTGNPDADTKNTTPQNDLSHSQIDHSSQPPTNYQSHQQSDKVPKPKSITIALIGIDEREGERSRSDSIMLIRYYPVEKRATLVSIPRDSKVHIPGYGEHKINAAHAYGGPPLLVATLEHLFHIEIDHFLKINFHGFIELVDAVGGVRVNAEKDFYKHWSDNSIYILKGEQLLDGEHALEYVRFRKDADGDFGRISRQQEVVISLTDKFLKPNNLFKIPEYLEIVKKYVESDLNWLEIFNLAWQLKSIQHIQFDQYTLKTRAARIDGIWFELIDEHSLAELTSLLQ